jgi:hypothetical protein
MRVGLVVSTPERNETYLIDVDEYNWQWSVRRRDDRRSWDWISDGPRTIADEYDKTIKATFSGIILAYPPLPGLPLKD